MILKRLTVGALSTNCYIVGCDETKDALIIDPGLDRKNEIQRILEEINRNNLRVQFIVNTHGHTDHTSGNGVVKEATGASILIHEYDAPMLIALNTADKTLHDGEIIKAGKVRLQVLHTPGHTQGSICLLSEKVMFTGDTLFAYSIGRTDLPGSSDEAIQGSLKRLITLPDHLKVYPGHGPASTMGKEKKSNPFLLGLISTRKPLN
jgi:glyoxylase-like metal-dependent hydrolase (beta-lactamase superfamily II)